MYSNSKMGIVTPPVYARTQDTVTAMCDWSPLDVQVEILKRPLATRFSV